MPQSIPSRGGASCQIAAWRSLNALRTTDTELALIAAAATIGQKQAGPGEEHPAAIGTPRAL